jgi:hypothetical protein
MTPLQQFVAALHAPDVERVRTLLATHAEVRAAINDPISRFDSRPVMRATSTMNRQPRSISCATHPMSSAT